MAVSDRGVLTTQDREHRVREYVATRDNPFFRWLYRAPLIYWRLGIGPLVTPTFLLLTTRGRKTGQPHRVLLDFQTVDGTLYVYSGYGERADWFRNALADSRVTVQTRHGTRLMRARRVTDPEEITRVFTRLMHSQPWLRSAALARRYLELIGVERFPEDVPGHADRFTILALEPTAEPVSTPPPLRADLWWVGPSLALAGLAAWRRLPRFRSRST